MPVQQQGKGNSFLSKFILALNHLYQQLEPPTADKPTKDNSLLFWIIIFVNTSVY